MIRRALLSLAALGLLGATASAVSAADQYQVPHAVLKADAGAADAQVTQVRRGRWGGYYRPYVYGYPSYSYYPYSTYYNPGYSTYYYPGYSTYYYPGYSTYYSDPGVYYSTPGFGIRFGW